jgi:type I restriction enzyme S subunit
MIKTVALGDVCSIARGGSPRPIEKFFTEDEDGLNWIKIGDVQEGQKYITSTKQKIRKEGLVKTRAVNPGDFLLSNSMSFGRPYITKIPGCIHDGWLVLTRNASLLNEHYLYHLLSSPAVYAQFEKYAVGAVVRNLNSEIVRKIRIPLPPISEQERIARILDKSQEIGVMRDRALAKLEELAQSAFVDLFGEPVTNSKQWDTPLFESQVESVRYGTGSPPPYVEEGIPFIRATNIKSGRVSTKDLRRISPAYGETIQKCRLKYGDLIIVRSGVNTGDCLTVTQDYEGAYAAFDLIVDLDPVSSFFYSFLLNSKFGRAILAPLTRRAAQPHLNAEQVKNLRLISPPHEKRRQFYEIVEKLEVLRGSELLSSSGLTRLASSLASECFGVVAS